jgi:hypothetical protein
MRVVQEGTMWAFTIVTPTDRQWAQDHLTLEWQWRGNTFLVDAGSAGELALGMQASGLTVESTLN